MTLDELVDHLDTLGVEQVTHNNSIESECPSCGTRGEGKFLIRKSDGKTVCFKGSCDYGVKKFDVYYSVVAGISLKEARDIISGKIIERDTHELSLNLEAKGPQDEESDELKPISWPPEGTYEIESYGGQMGAEYLMSRGIPVEIAKEYGIRFSINARRVYFPIKMGDQYYGYQARSIDKVEPQFRMLNNPGFKRSQMVMFANRLLNSRHAIITEGPVDAIKFHNAGGNICTMGKNISNNQIRLLEESGIDKIYLALDNDATADMRWIQKKTKLPCFLIKVPQSAIERCLQNNKKADFGECTFEECFQAFNDAEEFNRYTTFLYLGDD